MGVEDMVLLTLFATALGQTEPLTWAGVDVGLAHLLGPNPLEQPGRFAAFPDAWNQLFQNEMVGPLSARTKRTIRYDVGHLSALHARIDPALQVIPSDHPSSSTPLLTRAQVVARVASYPPAEPGMALTFIGEQLNRTDARGCWWVTWFDGAHLQVHRTTRVCTPAGGVGFRNYWFGSVKRVVEGLSVASVPPATEWVTLTDAELADAAATSAALATELSDAREKAKVRAAQQAEEERQQALASGAVPSDWVTIHVAPEGLALLKQGEVPFVVAKVQTAEAPTRPAVSASVTAARSARSGGSLEQQLADEAFDSNKVELLQVAASQETFTCARVANLLRTFKFDSERAKGACAVAPAVVDRQNVHLLESAFTFSSHYRDAAACF